MTFLVYNDNVMNMYSCWPKKVPYRFILT